MHEIIEEIEKEQLKEALYDLSALMKKVADDITTDK